MRVCIIITAKMENLKQKRKNCLFHDTISFMEEKFLSPKELEERMERFSLSYHLIDVHRDRLSFYRLTPDDLKKPELWLCNSGVCLNLIMDGELERAEQMINSIPDQGPMKVLRDGMRIVHPKVTWNEILGIIGYLRSINTPLIHVVLTAGRPSVINGFGDFSRIFPFLERQKDFVLEELSWIYDKEICPFIYEMFLAEYYYQQDRLLDAEVHVGKTIKAFDKGGESRLLFAALFLQTKILIAQGKLVESHSYIKNIRKYVKEKGEAEFSYNIDSADVMTAFYDGNLGRISRWRKNKSPDEYADFNMLDLYRYMVKMRCYIIEKKYTALLALAEKLRPLLEEGNRLMDLCEMDVLVAICFYRVQKKELAFEAFDRALKIARRRKFYRLVGDEGAAVVKLLIDYIKERGESIFLMKLLEIARSMAISHPLYLNDRNINTEALSQREVEILKLLEQGKSKEEISDFYFISENTVKFHMKNIFSKLKVKSSLEAVWEARVMGLI